MRGRREKDREGGKGSRKERLRGGGGEVKKRRAEWHARLGSNSPLCYLGWQREYLDPKEAGDTCTQYYYHTMSLVYKVFVISASGYSLCDLIMQCHQDAEPCCD